MNVEKARIIIAEFIGYNTKQASFRLEYADGRKTNIVMNKRLGSDVGIKPIALFDESLDENIPAWKKLQSMGLDVHLFFDVPGNYCCEFNSQKTGNTTVLEISKESFEKAACIATAKAIEALSD